MPYENPVYHFSTLSPALPSPLRKKRLNQVLQQEVFINRVAEEGVQLVDVRTPEEFEKGHLYEASNIDFLNSATFEEQIQRLDKAKPVYIYCRSGARSGKAAEHMKQLGFILIYDLEGGYMNLKGSEPKK